MGTILESIKFNCLILITSLCSANGFAQLTWTTQGSGTSYPIYAVDCISETKAWTAGDGGIVLSTVNSGNTWTNNTIITAYYLMGVSFVSPTVGWAVDYNGVIYKTTDGGSTWILLYSNSSTVAYEIDFVNLQTGWVSRIDDILFTEDGGLSWDSVPMPTSSSPIDIDFVDANNGYVMGATISVAKTTDGGQTWQEKTVDGSTGGHNDICVVNESTLYVAGDLGKIYFSNDNGDTWISQATGTAFDLYGIDFFDANHGVAVGDLGVILTTTDGGQTWITNPYPSSQALFGVRMGGPTTAWLTGNGGTIIHTQPGETDLVVDIYMGDDFACDATNVDIPVMIKNQGISEITEATFVITNSIGNLMLTYPWSGSLLPDEVENANLGSILIDGTDNYTISFVGDSVITNNTFSFPIEASDHSFITVSEPQIICPGDSVEINVFGGVGFEWLTLAAKDTLSYAHVSPNVDTYYPVKITYEAICEYIDTVLVQINLSCGGANLAFSPNEDGVNDYLYIEGAEKISNRVIIFDRWGEEITSFTNYNNADIVWYGDDKNGKSLIEGTYFYVIETGGVMVDGVDIGKGGWVQIVK